MLQIVLSIWVAVVYVIGIVVSFNCAECICCEYGRYASALPELLSVFLIFFLMLIVGLQGTAPEIKETAPLFLLCFAPMYFGVPVFWLIVRRNSKKENS